VFKHLEIYDMTKIILKPLLILLSFFTLISVNAQTAEVLSTLSFENLNSGVETNRVFNYDLNGKIVSEVETIYSAVTETWDNSEEITYTYSDNQIIKLKKEWDSSIPAWVNLDKWTYVENEAGNDIVKEFLLWDGSAFVNTQRNELTYNSSDQRTESSFLQHDGAGGWTDNYKYTYSYDMNGDLNIAFRYNYDAFTGEYAPVKRWSFSRDQDGLLLNRIESNYTGGSWSNYKKNINNYVDGKLESVTYEEWNESVNAWLINERRGYTYNNAGNITSMSFYDNPLDSTVPAQYSLEYGYEGLNADLVILPFYFDDDYREDHYQNEKLVTSDYSYRNPNTDMLELATREIRSYTILDGFVGILDNTEETINVFPNPASEILNLPNDINASFVTIYNVSGLLTKKIVKNSSQQIDVSSLAPGNYVLKVILDDRSVISKFQKL